MLGYLALMDYVISEEVYSWTAVVVLPINSALNPFLYTLTAIMKKKVSVTEMTINCYHAE